MASANDSVSSRNARDCTLPPIAPDLGGYGLDHLHLLGSLNASRLTSVDACEELRASAVGGNQTCQAYQRGHPVVEKMDIGEAPLHGLLDGTLIAGSESSQPLLIHRLQHAITPIFMVVGMRSVVIAPRG